MKKSKLTAAISSTVLGLLSPLAMMGSASAANAVWAGHHPVAGYDGMASTACNWESCYAPASGDTVIFPASGINQEIELDGFHTAGVGGAPNSLELAGIIFDGTWDGSSSKSYTVTSDHVLNLSGTINAIMEGSGGDHSVEASVTLQDNLVFSTDGSNSLSVGTADTTLDLNDNDLTLQPDGGTITLLGTLEGAGSLVKSGEGKVKLMLTAGESADAETFVNEGELSVDDDLGLDVIVDGGTLKGTGTVGSLTLESGVVAPGASPGVLNSGDLTFNGGSHEVELGGTADGEYDQLNVTGSVDLGSSTTLDISLFGGFEPDVDDVFVIIENNGSDDVEGTFEGLKDGEKVTLGDYTYQINYDAGSGNDVTLLVTGTPDVPDTGVGSLLSNPLTTIGAALLVGTAMAGYRIYEFKKVRK